MIHGAEHREAVLATLRSIAGLSSYTPERFTVVVLGDAPADPAALPLEVAYAASVDGFDLGTAADGAYVELIPAGLEYSPDAFDVFFADAAAGSLARCYIHREGAYAYRLNRTVGREDRGPVTLDDADRLWAGSTPRSCRSTSSARAPRTPARAATRTCSSRRRSSPPAASRCWAAR
ncbi:hypothetical protein [Leucobacter soli]|uniref:hypothetical protein n=1 Tax=Leucobacter soli TaxID=2812850 RepID=UPI0036083B3F